MDWTTQVNEMFKNVGETQKKIWEEWYSNVQGIGRPDPANVWASMFPAWQDSVKRTFDAQGSWTRQWSGQFTSIQGRPDEILQWAKQGQEVFEHWTKVHTELWATWFEIAKNLDTASKKGNWEQEGQKLMQGWQEAVQKGLESQEEWTRLWTAKQTGSQTQGKKKAEV